LTVTHSNLKLTWCNIWACKFLIVFLVARSYFFRTITFLLTTAGWSVWCRTWSFLNAWCYLYWRLLGVCSVTNSVLALDSLLWDSLASLNLIFTFINYIACVWWNHSCDTDPCICLNFTIKMFVAWSPLLLIHLWTLSWSFASTLLLIY
jgi:hypothetical protein